MTTTRDGPYNPDFALDMEEGPSAGVTWLQLAAQLTTLRERGPDEAALQHCSLTLEHWEWALTLQAVAAKIKEQHGGEELKSVR